MEVWKSPVFYFGLFLLMAVSLALAAPLVTDWNGYKPGLERFGQRLTGREVTIGGNVEISLFPWPRLLATDVTVGNPQGFEGPSLLTAETIQLELALAGLLNGQLDVQSVEIVRPRLTLLRNADGAVNWHVGPEDGSGGSTLLSQVRLDNIKVTGGALNYEDLKLGFRAAFDSVETDMAAAAIEGPWRLRGRASSPFSDFSFTLNSSAYTETEPLRVDFRAIPDNRAMPVVSFEANLNEGIAEGDVRITPQPASESTEAVSVAVGVAYQSKIRIDTQSERVDLSAIKVSPADARDSGTLIEGNAQLALGRLITATATLNAPRVNLDPILGQNGFAGLTAEQWPVLAAGLLRHLQGRLNADLTLDVGVLTYGGETINAVRVEAATEDDYLKIRRFAAGLPGRSNVEFDGAISQADGQPKLEGRLDLQSQDTRALARWLLPQHVGVIDSYWTGSRGRLGFSSVVTWTPAQTGLTGAKLSFDGAKGALDLSYARSLPTKLTVDLKLDSFNLDEHVPPALRQVSGSQIFDVLGSVAPMVTKGSQTQWDVRFASERLTINGQAARDVALAFRAGELGLEVEKLSIGSVGGARLDAQGKFIVDPVIGGEVVYDGTSEPPGRFTANLSAQDPSGFLQLMGFASPASRWPLALGQTEASLDLIVTPSPSGPMVNVGLAGTSGPQRFNFDGTLQDLERGGDARIALEGSVESDEAKQLLQLFGLANDIALDGQGVAKIDIKGTRSEGFSLAFNADASGTALTFNGNLKPGEAYSGVSGTLNVVSPATGTVFSALGIPVAAPEGELSLSASVVTEAGTMRARQVFGELAGSSFKGEMSFDPAGKLTGTLETGDVALSDLLAVALLPWDGRQASMQSSLARPGDVPFSGEIAVAPKSLAMPFGPVLKEVAVIFSLGDTRKVELRSPTQRDAELTMTFTPKDGGYEAALNGSGFVDVAQIMQLNDGSRIAEGVAQLKATFTAQGRSAAGILSSLKGEGTYATTGVALNRISPNALATGLAAATSSEQLSAALKAFESEGRFALPDTVGTVKAENGTLTFAPVTVASTDSETVVTTSVDLASGFVDMTSSVKLLSKPDLPPVSIGYVGPPRDLVRRASTAALASKLGHELLAKDLAELERLQKEQDKIEAAEQAQRDADVAKFEAYQAQRAEIRLRHRELRIFTDMRKRKAEAKAAAFAAFVPAADAMNKADLAKARQRITVNRKLAEFAKQREDLARDAEEMRRKALEAQTPPQPVPLPPQQGTTQPVQP